MAVDNRSPTDADEGGVAVAEPAEGRRSERPDESDPVIRGVRATDIEPYTGLRYLSKLFRFMAIILLLLLIAEIVTGLSSQGSMAIPTLLGEASRLVVLAGVLWGTGDLALLLIDVGHDVRAARIMMARQAYQQARENEMSEPEPSSSPTHPFSVHTPPHGTTPPPVP